MPCSKHQRQRQIGTLFFTRVCSVRFLPRVGPPPPLRRPLVRGKDDALVTKNMVPGESVYGEKRVAAEIDDQKIE